MILVDNIEKKKKDTCVGVCAQITANHRKHQVWFRWQGEMCPTPADAYLAAAIRPAMRLGSKLIIKGSVSERLLKNMRKIQEIYWCWDRTLSIVEIEVDEVRPWNLIQAQLSPQAPKDGDATGVDEKDRVGCLFSGGVDSFYSVLKHLKEIEALIFVHGFDIKLDDQLLRSKVSESLQNAASRLKKPLIEVETNLRQFCDRYVDWQYYYGGAISAVGIMLSGHLSKLYIPAGHSYADLCPEGSHPLLDPLFSIDRIEFEHDGCEAIRIEKVEAISANDVAMDTLRVCWDTRSGAYNCGRCGKCLRTMVSLEILGALDRCKTFNRSLNLKEVVNIVAKNEIQRSYVRENIKAGERLGADPKLLSALRRSLGHHVSFRPLSLYYRVHRTVEALIYRYLRRK